MGRISTVDSIKEYFSKGVNKSKWEEAKEKAKNLGSFGKYDDGKYEAQLVSIKTGRSKNGRLQVIMAFKFVSGEYKGKSTFKYIGIEEGTEYLLNDLRILGYEDPSNDEIEDVIFKELNKKKPTLSIRLKTKEGTEYQNTYLTGLTQKAEGEDSEEEESEEKENEPDNSEADDEPEATSETAKETDDDDESEGEEASEEKDSEDDEDAEEEPEPKEEEGAKLDVGTKVIVKVDGKEIKAKILKILEERKDNTGQIRVESLKTGKKYTIDVPGDVVDIIEE